MRLTAPSFADQFLIWATSRRTPHLLEARWGCIWIWRDVRGAEMAMQVQELAKFRAFKEQTNQVYRCNFKKELGIHQSCSKRSKILPS